MVQWTIILHMDAHSCKFSLTLVWCFVYTYCLVGFHHCLQSNGLFGGVTHVHKKQNTEIRMWGRKKIMRNWLYFLLILVIQAFIIFVIVPHKEIKFDKIKLSTHYVLVWVFICTLISLQNVTELKFNAESCLQIAQALPLLGDTLSTG